MPVGWTYSRCDGVGRPPSEGRRSWNFPCVCWNPWTCPSPRVSQQLVAHTPGVVPFRRPCLCRHLWNNPRIRLLDGAFRAVAIRVGCLGSGIRVTHRSAACVSMSRCGSSRPCRVSAKWPSEEWRRSDRPGAMAEGRSEPWAGGVGHVGRFGGWSTLLLGVVTRSPSSLLLRRSRGVI
jgi:hypothetical protein